MSLHAQLPNGEMTSEQMRFAASCIRPYGEDGCADITTRANLQLRGVKLEDAGRGWECAGLLLLSLHTQTHPWSSQHCRQQCHEGLLGSPPAASCFACKLYQGVTSHTNCYLLLVP